jgi:hypothetical protein
LIRAVSLAPLLIEASPPPLPSSTTAGKPRGRAASSIPNSLGPAAAHRATRQPAANRAPSTLSCLRSLAVRGSPSRHLLLSLPLGPCRLPRPCARLPPSPCARLTLLLRARGCPSSREAMQFRTPLSVDAIEERGDAVSHLPLSPPKAICLVDYLMCWRSSWICTVANAWQKFLLPSIVELSLTGKENRSNPHNTNFHILI